MARDILFKTEISDFYEFLEIVDELDYTVVAQGVQRRWNGSGIAGYYGSFQNLVYIIVHDFDDVTISEEKGHLYIDATDHDGGLTFEVKKVNDKGLDYFDKWQEKWHISEKKCHENIFKRMSVLPRLTKIVRGI